MTQRKSASRATHPIEQRANHVQIQRVAELEGARLVGTRQGRAANVDVVAPGAVLAQCAVDLCQRLGADASNRARRELEAVAPGSQVAGPLHVRSQVAEQDERLGGVAAQEIAQLLGGNRLEVALGQVARQLLESLDFQADLLRRLVVGRFPSPGSESRAAPGTPRERAADPALPNSSAKSSPAASSSNA